MTEFREAHINTDAITHNVRRFGEVTGTDVFAVVKSNAYGHGAQRSARAALVGGAAKLGVADLTEAVALRAAGITAPLIAWLHAPGETFARAVAEHIEVGISSFEQLQAAGATGPLELHLKVDTGLSRNGIAPADWGRVFAEAARLEAEGRVRVVGVFSHLSGTSVGEDRAQLTSYLAAVAAARDAGLRPQRHLAATAAAFQLPETRLDAVRVGVGIYGLSPFEDRTAADLGLTPAMTLRGQVAAVRRVPAGAGVSYGYVHRTECESTLALVPLGYADGIPRNASDRAPVVIGGKRYRVSGRIAMDQFVVDVGDAEVAVGDEVTLFGDPAAGAPSAAEWADAADTINYEIVTRIGNRVVRT